jgi:hypothetical protein
MFLTLYKSSYKNRVQLFFNYPTFPDFRSSTLLKLDIRVQCFDDCLRLLDGRFYQLHTLYIDLVQIRPPQVIENQVGSIKKFLCCQITNQILFFRVIYQT